MSNDQELIAFVQAAIRMGIKSIRVPSYLFSYTTPVAQQEVSQLCELNGVKIEAVA